MCAYYRGEHVPFPSVPSGQQLYGAVASSDVAQTAANASQIDSPVRHCSVRGCGNVLGPDYTLKMCDSCRGRHRVYASTKRAKRKLEKAALGAANGYVFMPQDDAADDEANDDDRTRQRYPYEASTWDHSSIDPALFSHDSELANALTLPASTSQSPRISTDGCADARRNGQQQLSPLHVGTSLSSGINATTINNNTSGSPSLTKLATSTSAPAALDAPSLPPRFCSIKGCKALVSGNSFFKMCQGCRDRYRSYGTTKRAKWKREKEFAVAELQKMRNEDDMRRAEAGLPPLPQTQQHEWREWQADGTTTVQPPTPTPDPPTPSIPLPPRMCTVSHCREILPGDYQYLRCERHRIQNRHHSKLKRVRDKESKAQAFDGWAAAVGVSASASAAGTRAVSEELAMESDAEPGQDHDHEPDHDHDHDHPQDQDQDQDASGQDVPAEPEGQEVNANAAGGVDTPFGEPRTGIPPAARGTRRTNHVCSIKACCNLLSPSNPWKMCDSCRARDRAGRREKALRDIGVVADTSASRSPEQEKEKGGGESALKKSKKKKKKADADAAKQENAGPAGSASVPADQGEGSAISDSSHPVPGPSTQPDVVLDPALGMASAEAVQMPQDVPTGLIFMEPLLPNIVARSTSTPPQPTSSITAPTDQTAKISSATSTFQTVSPNQPAGAVTQDGVAASNSKKKTKRKAKAPIPIDDGQSTVESGVAASTNAGPGQPEDAIASNATMSQGPSDLSVPSAEATFQANIGQASTTPDAPIAGAHMQHPYPMPYYMPPYNMTPYATGGPSPPYSYGTPPYPYPRPPYAPNTMYQPPYPPYAQAYAYPPQPYSQPYTPQGYAAPGTQPMYSVSSTFVSSRAEYAAASQSTHTDTTYTAAAGVPPYQGSYYSTFSAKTGEPHHRVTHTPSLMRRKRLVDEDLIGGANKRQAVEADQGAPAPSTSPDTSAALEGQANGHPVSDGIAAAVDDSAAGTNEAIIGQSKACSNKTCHRTLPADSQGSLCGRCKERLKKRAVKAKHRFKLEPRKLLGKPTIDYAQPVDHTVGGQNRDVDANEVEKLLNA
ncbi:hypothetical protein AcW1_001672 [Taiwanofungus camphoratus]|nr:hypothetical protein AcV7_001530 [Antrodia cinnamomea]KAI0945454.1 hypothetical protein AcW1_001672 [Antrodia cinnamomea]